MKTRLFSANGLRIQALSALVALTGCNLSNLTGQSSSFTGLQLTTVATTGLTAAPTATPAHTTTAAIPSDVKSAGTPFPSSAAIDGATVYAATSANDAAAYYCAGRSAIDSPQFFAAQLYFDILKRTPTIAEIQTVVPSAKTVVTNCRSNSNIFECVWSGYAVMALAKINSAESTSVNGSVASDTAFANYIYQTYRGAAPTASELTALLNDLSSGKQSRQGALVSALNSNNYRKKFFWGNRCGYPLMGVNVHSLTQEPYLESNGPTYDLQVTTAAAMGMKELRVGLPSGALNSSTISKTAKFLSAAELHKLDVLMVILPSSSSTATADQNYQSAYDSSKAVAVQFKGRIKTYEISNERDTLAILPSLSGRAISNYDPVILAQWAATFRGAADGLHSGDPATKVTFDFGFVHYGFLQGMLQAGVNIDVVALHWYQNMGDKACPTQSYPCPANPTYGNILTSIQALAPGKEIRITEMGYTPLAEGTPGYDVTAQDARQRDYLFNTLLQSMHRPDLYPVARYDIYELIAEENKTSFTEGTYGLIHLATSSDGSIFSLGTPKPIVPLFSLILDVN